MKETEPEYPDFDAIWDEDIAAAKKKATPEELRCWGSMVAAARIAY